MKIPPCDICGQPSTHMVRDVTRLDSDGKEWEEYETRGPVRIRCDAHRTHSRLYDTRGNLIGALTDDQGRGIPL